MIGDRKSEFKLKIKGKSEEKVRGYDARDVSLSHPRDCKPSLLLTRKLGLGLSTPGVTILLELGPCQITQ